MAKLETTLETIAKGSKQGENQYKIHSIALNTSNGASSILSAHMQTMSLLHDHQDTVFDPTIACDVIEPALEVERADKDDLRNQRVEGNGAVIQPKSGASNGSKSKPKVVTKKAAATTGKKSTSAAAFFKTDSEAKKKAKAADPKPAQTKKKASAAKKSSTAKKAAVEKKKPDSPQKKKGSADDFVGDMDEDEEFLKEEEERKRRNAEKEKKQNRERKVKENSRQKTATRKPLPSAEGEDDVEMDASDDGKEAVHGAMDDFAQKKTVKRDSAKADDKGRKRRKQVLEEKTFVDENGFLRTETVSVWKEIEDGEDEKATTAKKSTSSAATTKPKNTKNMKQQGLMGFFGKK